MAGVVLCFDFDHSFIDDNSDTAVPRLLAPALIEHIRARAGKEPWTHLMADVARRLHAAGRTPADIRGALDSIPVDANMCRAIEAVHAAGGRNVIVSDANEFYISCVLSRVGARFDSVVTNVGRVDETGLLLIAPYHTGPPHRCPRCPPNLCKGIALDGLGLSAAVGRSATTVVYVGDGEGDVCACLRLGPGDVVLARAGYPLLKTLTRVDVRARVVAWKSGADVLREVTAALARSHS